MALKPARSVRLSLEDIARIEGQAESRGVSQQVVMESAIKAWLRQAETGVVHVIEAAAKPPIAGAEKAQAETRGREEYARNVAARQAKLNEAKARASAGRR